MIMSSSSLPIMINLRLNFCFKQGKKLSVFDFIQTSYFWTGEYIGWLKLSKLYSLIKVSSRNSVLFYICCTFVCRTINIHAGDVVWCVARGCGSEHTHLICKKVHLWSQNGPKNCVFVEEYKGLGSQNPLFGAKRATFGGPTPQIDSGYHGPAVGLVVKRRKNVS